VVRCRGAARRQRWWTGFVSRTRSGAVIELFTPRNQPGLEREDDRRVISGILHVPITGCRGRNCPSAEGDCQEPIIGCLELALEAEPARLSPVMSNQKLAA
jgi:hypothetical protein